MNVVYKEAKPKRPEVPDGEVVITLSMREALWLEAAMGHIGGCTFGHNYHNDMCSALSKALPVSSQKYLAVSGSVKVWDINNEEPS